MKSTDISLLFLGNERLATAVKTSAPILKALINAGYNVKAVIANHTDPVSHQGRDLEIGQVAQSFSIPVILPGNKTPLLEKIKKHQTEAAILVAFGKKIPQDVIDAFPRGIINIHPSLLPKLRGPTPIETAILKGLNETGVSLMKISTRMDQGPIYASQKVMLSGNESKQDLANKLSEVGGRLLVKHLPDILSGKLQPIIQDQSQASYTSLIHKENGIIEWKKSARQLQREIRAYAGWPKSRTNIKNIDCIIIEAAVVDESGKPGEFISKKPNLIIGCADKALEIKTLQPAGKKPMSSSEFIRGYLN